MSKSLADASDRDLIDELRARKVGIALKRMTRTEWAEARHVIRYAYQDLNGLHTMLEKAPLSWQTTLVTLDEITASLEALRTFLTPRGQRPTTD